MIIEQVVYKLEYLMIHSEIETHHSFVAFEMSDGRWCGEKTRSDAILLIEMTLKEKNLR